LKLFHDLFAVQQYYITTTLTLLELDPSNRGDSFAIGLPCLSFQSSSASLRKITKLFLQHLESVCPLVANKSGYAPQYT
jgi:hypothetical protein